MEGVAEREETGLAAQVGRTRLCPKVEERKRIRRKEVRTVYVSKRGDLGSPAAGRKSGHSPIPSWPLLFPHPSTVLAARMSDASLPQGWIKEWDSTYNQFYFVGQSSLSLSSPSLRSPPLTPSGLLLTDTNSPNPQPTWTHPSSASGAPPFHQQQQPQNSYSGQSSPYPDQQQQQQSYSSTPQPSYAQTPSSYQQSPDQGQGQASSYYNSTPIQNQPQGQQQNGQPLYWANAEKTETSTQDRGFGKVRSTPISLLSFCLRILRSHRGRRLLSRRDFLGADFYPSFSLSPSSSYRAPFHSSRIVDGHGSRCRSARSNSRIKDLLG